MQHTTMPAPALPESRQANNFNLIRLALALLVIVSHTPEMMDGNRSRELLSLLTGGFSFGEFAVDGFFLLSGFLILQSWDSQPSTVPYLRKRLLRIVPGYLLAALLCAFVVGPLAAPAGYFAAIWPRGLGWSLLTLDIPATPAVFAGTHYASVNGAMWTIRYEFLCYLVLLALGLAGLLRRRALTAALLAAVLLLYAATACGALRPLGLDADCRQFPMLRFLAFFGTGMLYCRWRAQLRFQPHWAALAAAVLALGTWLGFAELSLLAGGSYLFFYLAFHGPSWLAPWRRLPDISYGVYLYGWPAGKLLLWYAPGLGQGAATALTMALACVCGLVSWHLVEKPALRLKTPRRPLPAPDTSFA